jgi:hypothetical protein
MVHTGLRWSQAKVDQPKNRTKNDYHMRSGPRARQNLKHPQRGPENGEGDENYSSKRDHVLRCGRGKRPSFGFGEEDVSEKEFENTAMRHKEK